MKHRLAPLAACAAAAIAATFAPAAHADQVVAEDQIVQGSQCIGFDCIDGESFGSDTLKLKENNLRILFDDTSTTAGFTATDWRLTANEQPSGGLNKFSIDDVTAGTTPFAVLGSAPSDSLLVNSIGNIGVGTANPLMPLHVRRGNTPVLRLEQDDSNGFTPQTWDVGGSEASFFVRDLTGGSRLPFRIRPGAPTSSIDIGSNGDVGVGTNTPDSAVHVRRSNGSAKLKVEETSTTEAGRVLAELVNNGPSLMRFANTATDAPDWLAGSDPDGFVIERDGGADAFALAGSGQLSVSGAVQSGADAAGREETTAVDGDAVLAKVRALDVGEWEYTADPQDARHLGPSGADFRTAFGLGAADGFIAPSDQSAVALVAIKALAGDTDGLDTRVDTLETGATGFDGRLKALSDRVDGLVAQAPADQSAAITALQGQDTKTAKQLKAMRKSNRKLARRVKALERRVRKR